MSAHSDTQEHNYVSSNRLDKFWPISSSRMSDIPNRKVKHRRRSRKVPVNQPLIDAFFARSPSSDLKNDINRSLFSAKLVKTPPDPSQTLIDDFFKCCNVNDSKKEKVKKMLFSSESRDETSDSRSDMENLLSLAIGGTSISTGDVRNRPVLPHSFLQGSSSQEGSKIHIMPMSHSAENTFKGYVDENLLDQAIDFVSMIRFQKPSASLLQIILHNILLETESTNVLVKTGVYLYGILELYPPSNKVSQEYYSTVLFENKKKQRGWSKWDTVLNIIKCCKEKCGYGDSKCKRNCMDFFKFLIAVLQKEQDELNAASRLLSPMKHRQCPILIRNLMWPDREPNSSSRALQNLILEIDMVFERGITEPIQMEFVENLLKLVCLSAECTRLYENMTEEEAISSIDCAALKDMYQHFCCCTSILRKTDNLRVFIESINVEWFRLAVCESLLNECVRHAWHTDVRKRKLNLRKFVFSYMFMMPHDSDSSDENDSEMEKKTSFKKGRHRIMIKKSGKGKTIFHDLIANDLGGTLVLRGSEPENYKYFNTPDERGWTPLHEAVYIGCSISVGFLLDSERKGPACDVYAADKTRLLPLHLAVWKDSVRLAKQLLDVGGKDQILMANDNGVTPYDLVKSEGMEKLLDRYISRTTIPQTIDGEPIPEDIQHLFEVGNVPEFKTDEECEIYLCYLQLLLGNFISFYDLLNLYSKSLEPGIEVFGLINSHFNEIHLKCNSYSDVKDNLEILKYLKLIVENFSNKIESRYGKGKFDITAMKLYADSAC